VSEPHAGMRSDLGSGVGAMARGAGVNLLALGATTALGFALAFVITHVISAHDFGLFSLASSVIALAFLPALLGLDTGVIRFVALGAGGDNERRARGAFQLAVGLVVLTSSVVTALLWWYAPWIAGTVFEKPDAADVLRIVTLSLPGVAIGRVIISAIRGFGVMTYAAWLSIVSRLLDSAVALPILALGFGVEGLAWASVVSAYAALPVAVVLLLRVDPHALLPAVDAWPVRRLVTFSLPQTFTVIFFLGVARLDILLLGRFGSAAEVGIYAIALAVVLPATLVSTAIGQMFSPRVAAEDAHGDRRTLETMLRRVTFWNTAASLPFFAALAILAEPILELFGSTYASGATALAILALGRLLHTAAGPLGMLINMSGRPYITMLNNMSVTLLNIGLGFALIPRFGMTGAAISASVSLAVLNLINVVEVRVIFGIYPFRRDSVGMFGSAIFAILVAAPVAFLPSWPTPVVQVAAAGLALFAAYALAMHRFGLTGEERALLSVGRARLTRRVNLGRP
jgi:O-antigen/teichoic acid export membrane protein